MKCVSFLVSFLFFHRRSFFDLIQWAVDDDNVAAMTGSRWIPPTSATTTDNLIKMMVSSLHYNGENVKSVEVLEKVLKCASEVGR